MADSQSRPQPGALSPPPLPGLVELPTLQASTVLTPVTEVDADALEGDPGDGSSRRQHLRLVAPPCRPITLRSLLSDDDGEPQPWLYADILDISLGGLCLLITADLPLELGQRFSVDFRAHRLADAEQRSDSCLMASLRWFVHAGYVTTLGLGFDQPLIALPELLPERRQRLRDPNPPSTRNADAPAGTWC